MAKNGSRVNDLESGVPVVLTVDQELEAKALARAEAIQAEKMRLDQFRKTHNRMLAAGNLFTFLFIILVLCDWIDFSKVIKTKPEDLEDIQSRIGFVLRYSTPGAMWLMRCLYVIIFKRARCPAIDPTSGNEDLVLNAKNILNNSFEQFILVLVSNLILVQHLDGLQTLKYIPAQFFLFMFGRFTYWLGYPKYRMFGFSLNIVTISVTMAYNLFKSWEALL